MRWAEIRECFGPRKRWISLNSSIMIKLMGKTPRDALEGALVAEVFLASHALHREGPNPFIALRGEATLDEVKDLLRRLGPCAGRRPSPVTQRRHAKPCSRSWTGRWQT